MRFLAFLFLLGSAVSALAQNPPTGLTATAIANEQVRLNWTAPATPTPSGYHVYRESATETRLRITTLNEVGGSATSFIDDDPALVAGTAYTYVVTSYIGTTEPIAESAASNEATATPVATPSAPLNLKVTGRTSTTVSLSWGEVEGATSYIILRDGDEVDEVEETTYTDTGLELSTSYSYNVRAVTAGGTSGNSNTVTVITFGDGSGKEAVWAKRFRQIDVDADGELSFDEYLLGHGARLAWVVVKHRYDYSNTDDLDGITLSEYAKALGGRKFMAPSRARQFLLADQDESGDLDPDEYRLMLPSRTRETKALKMFNKKNKDTSDGLTPDELGIRIINNPEEDL